ncbi:hypothetical protein [uncultured Nostoc sp.]|uniref:hypothetical protein n=1 Tax=uncultured Nostoc sp. TaxID=340711 RepID=UPI0035CC0A9C
MTNVTAPWARRTLRLAQQFTTIGLALGGAAGVRLSRRDGLFHCESQYTAATGA